MVATVFVLLLSLAAAGVGSGDPAAGQVSGVVVGPDGRPAPGAEVIAVGGDWEGEAPTSLGSMKADAEGRFSMALAGGVCLCERPTLWAYRPGSVAASAPIERPSLAGQPVRLALGSPARSEFVVAGPDGKPLAGVRIIPRRLYRDDLAIPSALADLASATTDERGQAAISAFRPEELVAVRVEAPGFGTQARDFRGRDGQADPRPKEITLIRTGRVRGRVSADDPSTAAGLKVRVTSSVGGREVLEAGIAEATTDAAGRFEVDAIAAGSVTVRVRPRANSADLPAKVVRLTLEAGKTMAVEVPLRRGVRVKGVARDALDGRPIAGVLVAVVPPGPSSPSRVSTDLEGRYETYVPAGLVTHRVLRVPDPYLCPPEFLGPRPVEVPPAIAQFELPPIALTRGADLRGSVVDEENRAVAGARIEASWTMFDGRVRAPRSAVATSRPDGSFVLGPVDPGVELSLSASTGHSGTLGPIRARASEPGPIVLTVVEPDSARPSGRVVDDDGQPVAAASVRIWSLSGSAGGSMLSFDGVDHLRTDAHGRFRGPRRLHRDREYRAMAEAPGHAPGRTRALRPGPTDDLQFPEIVLKSEPRRYAVEGRVLDRQGRAVDGVEVRSSRRGPCFPRALTGPDGKFRLEDVVEGRDFLFAEVEGYRFVGQEFDPALGPFDLTLTRLDEVPDRAMRSRTPAPPDLAMARSVLAPYLERVLRHGDHATRVRTLERLSRIDPRQVLALIGAREVEDAWFADHLRQTAADRLIRSHSVDEGLAVLGSIRDAHWRAEGYLEAADAVPGTAKVLKREWIEHALRDARTIRDPSSRVIALAGVAGRLIDLGESDRAARLLADSRPLAESLSGATSGGRARASFAECLARVDPDHALAMTEALVDPGAFDLCRLRIARSIAGRDPAQALRVLASVRDPGVTAGALPEVCHAMARLDPGRARRLIAQVGPGDSCVSAYALGMMALAVADADKLEATAWLREAFDLLAGLAASGPVPPGSPEDPAAVAAALLPVAEQIDPKLVPELFWRAVSLHAPRPVAEIRSESVYAMLLSRYDRSVALAFFEPLAARAGTTSEADIEPLVTAAATLDPGLAGRLIDGLPEAPDLAFHHPRNEARLAMAAALTRPAPDCWDDAVSRFLHLWTPETPLEE